MEFAVDTPAERTGTSLADWIEALMLVEGLNQMSRTGLRRRLRGLGSPDLEFEIDLLLSEVDRRRRIAPNIYPFELTSRGVRKVIGTRTTIYSFLLLLASPFAPVRRDQRYSETDEWFDSLVLHALRSYLGEGAAGVRFGWPASGDRPASFVDAIKWLARLLALSEGAGEPSEDVKDGGVDVVVWKHFADQRSGFLVVLAQATAREDWRTKLGDVLLKRWHGWIDFGADPVTALAFPFAISQDWERWDDLRRATTLLLDRLRICELVQDEQLEQVDDIDAWLDGEFEQLRLP